MSLLYAAKHMLRSWKLFLALLIGITLASTFFAGIDIKANATARQALDQQLNSVYVDMIARMYNPDPARILEAKENVLSINGIKEVEIFFSCEGRLRFETNNSVWETYVRTAGIETCSHVYDGWLNRPSEIGENETYVAEGSPLAEKVQIGEFITVNYSVYDADRMRLITISQNLTVKGFAQLDDEAYSILMGYAATSQHQALNIRSMASILIVDWEKTALKLSEAIYSIGNLSGSTASLMIYLDRTTQISAWDIETSVKNVWSIAQQVGNRMSTLGISVDVTNNLNWVLNAFQMRVLYVRVTFTIMSLPIFFVAWYMGTTVSDVSYNLRRREIGLLSTKGFSRRQVLGIFLTETLILGIVGGALGIFLGFLLNPIFTHLSIETMFNPDVISPFTATFTITFGVVIAFLSTYNSAKKASQLATVDALREYLPEEEAKSYKKRWSRIALILGTYKMAVFLLGINMTQELTRIMFGGGNFVLTLLVGMFMFVDYVLNYIGPVLFFWGFTKLFIQGSLEFQALTTKAARFLGDLGTLATRNVRRNPARAAAVAFLIALIVGYGVQVIGQLASEEDFTVRNTRFQIGGDITVQVSSANNAIDTYSAIVANISESLENATTEYQFEAYTNVAYLPLKAVEPDSWLQTAYWEDGWFSGNSVAAAFNKLETEENATIVERRIAVLLNLKVGDSIALGFGSTSRSLKVVGFFGPEPTQQGAPGYWSFVSEDLYGEVKDYVSADSARILLKLKNGINGTKVAESVRNLQLQGVSSVSSLDEALRSLQSDVVTVGILDAQRLGIVFAVLAASAGTALVSLVSMKERNREAAMMSVRGLSYKQLVVMLLTENLAVVVFSVVLGLCVGLIVVYGNVSVANGLVASLVQRRLTFPPEAIAMLSSCVALIFVSTILPILILSRNYVTKLERMVRLR